MNPLRPALLAAASAAVLAGGAFAAADDAHLASPFEAQRTLAAVADSIQYAARIQNGNKLGMTLTNYGFVGTNFSSFAPSFEYPLGSGHMHMVRGGPWVGAISADEDGAFTGVTIAAEDGGAGSSSASATEFTPAGLSIIARSTLPNSRFYDPDAVSELDFISRFSDRPADTRKKHRPLNLIVSQYTYEWSFSDYGHFIIFHYVFHNDGPPLRNVWLGMYDELASGNMRLQSTYPPSGWFSKKLLSWVDSLSMVTERYCQSPIVPAQCRFDLVPEIAGVKLLGVKPGNYRDTTDKKITFAAWNYSPGDSLRDEDFEKYDLMSSGQKTSLNPLPTDLSPVSGDPVTLLAVGPFPTVNPGDSISVDFAYIGALTLEQLSKRAIIAQRAYDLDYVVPVPPPSPKLKVVARENALDFYWDESPENYSDPTSPIRIDFEGYRLYLGENRDTLQLIGQYDLAGAPHDTTGFNTGLAGVRLAQPVEIEGVTYHYKRTVDHLRDGFKYFVAVTSYDIGDPNIEPLESGFSQNEVQAIPAPAPGEKAGAGISVFPNPYRVEASWDRGQQAKDHYVWFANLPDLCSIHIYTLSGDLIYETEFDGKSYTGSNARGVSRAGDLKSVMSGTLWGWDLITRQGQAAATGLYMWAVEDKHSGKRETGKFLIVKSDREGF